MLFCCLWRNVETSCHKHFVVVSRHQQTPPRITNLPHCSGTVLISPGGRSVDSTRRSQILAQNRDFCLPHRHSTPPLLGFPSEYCHDVWYGNTRMAWLPDGEKKSEDMITRFDRMYERDGQTDIDVHRMTVYTPCPEKKVPLIFLL